MSKEYFCDCSQCLQLDFDKNLREFDEIEDIIEDEEIDHPVEEHWNHSTLFLLWILQSMLVLDTSKEVI